MVNRIVRNHNKLIYALIMLICILEISNINSFAAYDGFILNKKSNVYEGYPATSLEYYVGGDHQQDWFVVNGNGGTFSGETFDPSNFRDGVYYDSHYYAMDGGPYNHHENIHIYVTPARGDGAQFIGYVSTKGYTSIVPSYMSKTEFEDLVYNYVNGIEKEYTFETSINQDTLWGNADYGYKYTFNTKTKNETNHWYKIRSGARTEYETLQYVSDKERTYFPDSISIRKLLDKIIQPGEKYNIVDAGVYAQSATALWSKPLGFTITFNTNGGSVSIASQTASTITLPNPGSKTGYTFAGWYNGSTRVGGAGDKWTPSSNVTLTAQWTPRTDTKYVVKHQLMNVSGSGYTLKDTENLKGTTDTNVTPARKSYTGFTAPAAQTAKINADGSRVFTYSYSRNKYTATFNGNGGTASKTSASLYYEATLGTLPTATRTGYNFKGWYTAASGGTQITSSTKLMGNTTYYAQWTPITYTITYKLNGGKVDYKKVKYNIETPTFYVENPTKKGYNFTGWTGTGISTATTDLSVPLGSYGNKTFEATWGDGVYAISFDGNGATSGSMETINVKAGESVKLPENGFVRDGYSFVGWYTTKEDRFGTFYKNGAEITDLTESITLHAQWRLDRGTHVHDGSNDPEGNGSNGSGTGSDDTTGGNGEGGSTGGNTSGAGGNGSGSAGDNNDNGSGNNGDRTSTGDGGNGKDVTGRGDDDKHNTPVITPKDEIGYFGTGKKRNEISLLTSLGMNDKKLTLNYNY